MGFDIALDLFPLLAGMLAAVGCALLGNFLVLRKLSLMGDAISHSVLPGLVLAFVVTASRDPLAMFIGAAAAGIGTVILVELVKRFGRVEPGAAMGVVFSLLFALGVLLIEQVADHVDLDADCVLHGQLETLVWWGAPTTLAEVLSVETLRAVPRQVVILASMVASSILFMTIFFKELRIAAFDPALATTQGFNATLLHYVLMIFIAAATVASFEAVGSILVIAMLICPAATARLLTDRLLTQIVLSALIAIVTSAGGYVAASMLPALVDRSAVDAAGMMAVVAGVALTGAIVFSPRHGVVARAWRRRRMGAAIALDDFLGALYRGEESGSTSLGLPQLRAVLSGATVDRAMNAARRAQFVDRDGDQVHLTDAGRRAAANVVRRHRLWEHYLVAEAGVAADHVHETAEQLEHMPTVPPAGPAQDPHGRDIPGGPPPAS